MRIEYSTIDELFDALITPNSTVFDIGAHIGDTCDRYLSRGASVVCVEPIPECVEQLRQRFANEQKVTVVAAAVSAELGSAELEVCSSFREISTLSTHWKEGRFRERVWDRRVAVDLTTLDQLIETYGRPVFCKIDVEGHEQQVLEGLGCLLPALCFEFAVETLDETRRCLERLSLLGFERFNLVFGREGAFALKEWGPLRLVTEAIASHEHPLIWGDVYAVSITTK